MGPDDRELVARCQAGELAAFEPLVERYRQRVWRLAYNVVRDREEAWDVVQEAFIRAYQALPSFRGQSAFYTWLFRIVMNVAADRVRQRAARGRAFGTERVPEEEWDRVMADQGRAPDDAALRTEDRERIQAALEALSEDHRAIIMLSDVEGLSYREIAEVLDIPMGTVMSRLHNARKRLRAVLGRLLAVLFVLAAALGVLAGPALGQSAPAAEAPPGGPGAMVRFGGQVLLATDAPPPPPAVPRPSELPSDPWVNRLRGLFRYQQYTPVSRLHGDVPVGVTQRWVVLGDRQLELTPQAVGERNAVRLRVRLIRGMLTEVTTNLQTAPGAPAVIGGFRHDGGTLIIILWATPNPNP